MVQVVKVFARTENGIEDFYLQYLDYPLSNAIKFTQNRQDAAKYINDFNLAKRDATLISKDMRIEKTEVITIDGLIGSGE